MNPPTIELSMIVKDGATTLRRCFDSVSCFIDRIVIGDTGSTDGSQEISWRYGAEVFQIPWEQDFARARNRVLERSQCDWILILDADEMLDDRAPSLIEQLIAQPKIYAYDVLRWNYIREAHSRSGEQAPIPNPFVVEATRPYLAYILSLNTRLFRRHPEIYFEYCVHETVSKRVDALGLARASANFVIHHFGQAEDTESLRHEKNELYRQLGLKKIQVNPNDYRAYFELGLGELEHSRKPATALAYFERSCVLKPQYAPAWLFAGICLTRIGRNPEALALLTKAHALGLCTSVLYEAMGDAHFHSGKYREARGAYEDALTMGSISPLNRSKLGACEVHLRLIEQGTRRIQQAIEDNPDFGELYDILSAAALLCGNLSLAAQAAERRLTVGTPDAFHYQLAAELHIRLGSQAEAREISRTGLSLFPNSPGLRTVRGPVDVQAPQASDHG